MKFRNLNKKGFTLTEVMIGMMILTIAIVAATNLLISLIRANENNVKTLQAYYLAQEGIELVRNVRDTNWIHNLDWKGGFIGGEQDQLWGSVLDGDLSVDLVAANLNFSAGEADLGINKLLDLKTYLPVGLDPVHSKPILRYDGYLSSEVKGSSGEDTGFVRDISIEPYLDNAKCKDLADQCILVTATVKWKLGSRDKEFSLNEILTNWKGGAL